jgi:hypothetical protein
MHEIPWLPLLATKPWKLSVLANAFALRSPRMPFLESF